MLTSLGLFFVCLIAVLDAVFSSDMLTSLGLFVWYKAPCGADTSYGNTSLFHSFSAASDALLMLILALMICNWSDQVPRLQPSPLQSLLPWQRRYPQVGTLD